MFERLNFLRFLLRDGQLRLCAPQAKQIWHCLAEEAVFATDRFLFLIIAIQSILIYLR